jgi:hypothetical protein
LASANNINSKSSSGDQIFDTMGRGSAGQQGVEFKNSAALD